MVPNSQGFLILLTVPSHVRLHQRSSDIPTMPRRCILGEGVELFLGTQIPSQTRAIKHGEQHIGCPRSWRRTHANSFALATAFPRRHGTPCNVPLPSLEAQPPATLHLPSANPKTREHFGRPFSHTQNISQCPKKQLQSLQNPFCCTQPSMKTYRSHNM